MKPGKSSFLLFLLGLGSATKIFFMGTVALSELVIFFIAPFLVLKHWNRMRHDGFLKYVYMLAFMTTGLFISAVWNHTPFVFTVKSFAIQYGFFSFYVVFYSLLHDNFKGVGWYFLGSFISGVITIWAFNPTAEVSTTGFVYMGEADVESLIQGPLFWVGKIRGLGQLPIFAEYLKIPLIYSILAPVLFVAFAMLNTVSGRGQSMCVLVSCVMMLFGGKSRHKMQTIGKHFCVFAIVGMVVLLTYKAVYSYAASNGYLGEDARNKYEAQTARGKGAVSMLVSGRSGFFIALSAIVDCPIIGFGPRAPDRRGYTERFISRYGTYEELCRYYFAQRKNAAHNIERNIPTHSHIMGAWLECGLPGLVFFLWSLHALIRHIRKYSAAVPQWYGFFAITIPSMVWSIFFNPVTSRSEFPLLMVLLFFAKAVGDKKMALPYELEVEARKYDKIDCKHLSRYVIRGE